MPLDPSLQEFSTSTPSIISYNWTDFIQNVGYLKFYASSYKNDTTMGYVLSDNVLPTSTNFTKVSDLTSLDFSITFLQPQTIKGDAILQYHWYADSNGNNTTVTCTASIRKNSTEIATQDAQDLSTTSVNARTEINKITIPETDFAIGDVLTLRFVMDEGAGSGDGYLLHNPADADFTLTTGYWSGAAGQPTSCKLYLPFKLI